MPDLDDVKAKAKYHSAAGSDGKSYPNKAWIKLFAAYNQRQGLCTKCGNKYDFDSPRKHFARDCASLVEYSGLTAAVSAPVAAVHYAEARSAETADAGLDTAMPDLAEGRMGISSVFDACCATLNAKPFARKTLLFAGAVGTQGQLSGANAAPSEEQARILLDTGSSNCFVDRQLAGDMPETGRTFNVTLAKQGTFLTAVPEVLMHVQMGEYTAELPALKLPLPDGIDAILGMDWVIKNNVDIMFSQRQVNFIDQSTGQPHIIPIPAHLQLYHDVCNAAFSETSAARCHAGQEVYMMLVRAVDEDLNCASSFAAHADEVSSKQASCADEIRVEQPELQQAIKALVQEFGSVFPAQVPDGLPPRRVVSHAIPIQPGATPVAQRTRRLSYAQEQEMLKQVKGLLDKGWIDPSASPWGSPILFVKKKDGGMRMCVDYRAVNKLTVRNSYPLPRIDDMLDRLSGSSISACLDLQQAYHQVRLSEEDVPKTAFTTPIGLFEYKVLPFGLCNAPSTFQALMNSVLGPELRHCCLVYLDDIIVFSRTPEEHVEHLRAVLQKLQDAEALCKAQQMRIWPADGQISGTYCVWGWHTA